MRFTLAGFPVEVHPSFFILSVLLGISARDVSLILVWVGVVFVSILVHELGHAFAIRSYGMRASILLYSMGGLTSWHGADRLRPHQRIFISVAGPGAGLALGGLVYALSTVGAVQLTNIGRFAVLQLLWVNIVWSIVNLMPIVPLDGGNVVRELVRMRRGYHEERLPALISFVVAVALVAVALSMRMTFAAFMAGWLAYANYMTYKGAALGAQFPGMGR